VLLAADTLKLTAMKETVLKLLSPGKGLLALDWSPKTIAQKFSEIGLTSTPELNRQYRQMLVTTPGLEQYVSGVILHEETAMQKLDSGETFPEFLSKKGIIPGIKVDQGGEKFATSDEEITIGLTGLGDRLKAYSALGLKFTKWRSLFKISDTYPTKEFLEENLNRLVESSKIILSKGLVPVLEPEVSMKGTHTTTRCAETTEVILKALFNKLADAGIDLGEIILKTNMITPGQDNGIKAEPLEVAEATLRIFKRSLPDNLPGVVFLSGGQTPDQSTFNLNEIVKRKGDAPWDLTYSYARALQGEALNTWAGKSENINAGQTAFLKRLEMVSKARKGEL
jgi:fructose-bisphosphate aldolase class I